MTKTYFVDSSALLKRYIPEEGSEWMLRLFAEDAKILISTVTHVEVASNLQRLLSVDKSIDRSKYVAIRASFYIDIATGKLDSVGVTPSIVGAAVRLLEDIYITPGDAIQIASAMSLEEGAVIVSSDRKMNKLLSTLQIPFADPTQQYIGDS